MAPVSAAGAARPVMTVTGPVAAADLGTTLMHEHVFFDLGTWQLTAPAHKAWLANARVGADTFAAVYRDLGVAFLGVSISLVIGTTVGILLSTARHRLVVAVTGSLIDAINALPLLVLAIALIALFGPGLSSVIIVLAMTNWARYARIARTRAMIVNQLGYIEAARLLGYPRWRIMLRHFVPNVSSETIAYALSDFILVIMLISGLSFLSLGATPPTAEWGVMMSEGRPFVQNAWWMTIFPGLALCWAGISLSFITEGLSRRERGPGE